MENSQHTNQNKHTLKFTGKGGEYFKIWIVNILLSIVTLGIYSAWAKVRTNRYFYGNTLLDDAPFEYHATPKQILIGRLIAFALFAIYIAISELFPIWALAFLVLLLAITPWIVYRSIRFNARVTSHRNVRFGFSGTAGPMYKYLFLLPMIPVFILGAIAAILHYMGMSTAVVSALAGLAVLAMYLTYPWVQRNVTQYVMNHYTYGQGQFAVDPALSTKRYYWTYFVAVMVSIIAFAVVGGLIYSLGLFDALKSLQDGGAEIDPMELQSVIMPLIAVVYGVLFLLSFLLNAFIKTSIRNHVFARTKLDDIARLESTITTGKLFLLLFTNFLLLIFTLGLAYPWIKVRLARYFTENTNVAISGDLSQYVSEQQEKQSALGEEMGDVFDVDMDLGL